MFCSHGAEEPSKLETSGAEAQTQSNYKVSVYAEKIYTSLN